MGEECSGSADTDYASPMIAQYATLYVTATASLTWNAPHDVPLDGFSSSNLIKKHAHAPVACFHGLLVRQHGFAVQIGHLGGVVCGLGRHHNEVCVLCGYS